MPDNPTIADDILKRAAFRITKARTQLIMGFGGKFVFWATPALHLEPVPVCLLVGPDGRAEPLLTMATNGRHLLYNPLTVASNMWDDDELLFVVAHEVDHCVKSHPFRRDWREPKRWNIACDRTINPELVDAGLKMPKGGLYNKDDFGKAAERLYLEVTDEDVEKCFGKGMDCGGTGVVVDAPPSEGQTQAQANAEMAHEWELIARQAAYMAKAQGHLPGAYAHLLEPRRPKLDPRQVLRDYITMCAHDDYTWKRPNRRFVRDGMYLPSLRSESVGPVFIGIDVSGSVDDDIASRFLGFVDAVLQDVRPEKTWLVQCDAQIQASDSFTAGERLPRRVKIVGRGGTDMRPLWAWQKEQHVKPVCSIVLSDMGMDIGSFGRPPGHPVLWISSEPAGRKAPFGQTIEMPS